MATADRRAERQAFERVVDRLREDAAELPKLAPTPEVSAGWLAAMGRAHGDKSMGERVERLASWDETH
jgi:hypothetical protein